MNTEGETALLIYCCFGLIGLGMNGVFLYWRLTKAREYYKRKEHILDQASLRLREVGLIIEELWRQRNQQKKI